MSVLASNLTAQKNSTRINELWVDALAIAQALAAEGIPLDVTSIANGSGAELPYVRTKRAPASRVEVEFWPTDSGQEWHIFHRDEPLLVLPTDRHIRAVAQQIAALHWRVTS